MSDVGTGASVAGMDEQSPIALSTTWDLVAGAYASEVAPSFEAYAHDALERVGVGAGAAIADIATGPGTLALLAARRGARVDALDFSPDMLARLRERLAAAELTGVTTHQGDGMALPFKDASYDAAFSMFGLFMFPDRARGFAELWRVLRPGAQAAVTSWQPPTQAPTLLALFEELHELMPEMLFGQADGPLTDARVFAAEMGDAGFEDVEVVELIHAMPAESTQAFVASVGRSCAPVALLAENLGPERWGAIEADLCQKLSARIGDGPHEVTMPAWLGLGTRAL